MGLSRRLEIPLHGCLMSTSQHREAMVPVHNIEGEVHLKDSEMLLLVEQLCILNVPHILLGFEAY